MPQLRTHLRDNYAAILQLSIELGGLGSPMQQWMSQQKACWDRAKSQGPQRYSGATRLSVYLGAHYGDLLSGLTPDHPLAKVVQAIYPQDLYSAFMDLAIPHLPSDGVALDVGCNVGRLTWELAGRCKCVYGVDVAFGAVLTARRLFTGQPKPLATYKLVRDGLNIEDRPLNVEPRSNVDLVVASGLVLPFARETFDVVGSANLIDVTPAPGEILRAKTQVLRSQGIMLTTDPYWWGIDGAPLEKWLGGYDGIKSEQAVRQMLVDLGFEIVAEQDTMPWILRYHDRRISLHFNHSLVARKI
jgi:SAM-dependent methyltransferase